MFKKIINLTLATFFLTNLLLVSGNFQQNNTSENDLLPNLVIQKVYADDDGGDDEEEDEDDDRDEREERDEERKSSRRNRFDEDNYVSSVSAFISPELTNQSQSEILNIPDTILTTPEISTPKTTMLAEFLGDTQLMSGITELPTDQSLDFYTNELVSRGIVSDFDPISYDRFSPATRIDALRLILNTAELSPNDISNEASFPDVSARSWITSYASTAKAKGIVKGYEDNTFKPLNNVTRSEFLKMLFKTYNYDFSGNYPRSKSFSDEDNLHWSSAYLETAKLNNIIKGYGDGSVGPEAQVTKGEIAKMVLLASKKTHEGEFMIPEMMNEIERNELLNRRELEKEQARIEQERIAKENAKKPDPFVPAPVKSVPVSIPVSQNNNVAVDAARIAKEKAAVEAARIAKEKANAAAAAANAEAARIAKEKAAAKAAADAAAAKAAAAKKAAADAAARARNTRRS